MNRNEYYQYAPENYQYDGNSGRSGSKKGKWILIGSIAVVVIAAVVVAAILLRGPQFEINPYGQLYYEGDEGMDVEIPREYDGIARGFQDKMGIVGFSYDGSLKDFVRYHSWIFREVYDTSDSGYNHRYFRIVECDDYTLHFAINGNDLGGTHRIDPNEEEIAGLPAGFHKVYYKLIAKGGKENSFSSIGELGYWLGLR